MEYTNRVVAPEQLPTPDEIAYQSLHRRYLPAMLIYVLIQVCTFLMVLSIVRFQPWFAIPEPLLYWYLPTLFGVMLIGVLFGMYLLAAVPMMAYCLREHDLHFVSGLMFRQIVSQPILRIQHVELKRGPIERLFGLATLRVYSAGGASHTFEIPGLGQLNAQQLRQYLLTNKDLSEHG